MSTTSTWSRQSVRSFWQGVNWENRPQIVPSLLDRGGDSLNGQTAIAPTLSLKFSVTQYFSMIPWSGVPLAAAPVPLPTLPIAEEKKETLEDFLDDISSFF
ncbi:hypothetical protein V2H45_22025 [Tumidithrix elongata RA019]|uniref:Uncharacterized protein n=1 Tax=Tumidithrix elongata BACA0141 TaxID=2716417 RepID=A0AAW9Q7G0_9CYAN|nr:hypothetical protein [Tumidithrix elongata RA019]